MDKVAGQLTTEDKFNASIPPEKRWAFKVNGEWLRPEEIARLPENVRSSPEVRAVIHSMPKEQFCTYLDHWERHLEAEARKKREPKGYHFAYTGCISTPEGEPIGFMKQLTPK